MYQSGKTTTLWNYSLLAGERRTSGKRIRGCAWDVTHAVSMQRARSSSLGLFSGPYSPECVEGEFSEVRSKGELLLDHRLCWLSRGYGVRVPMHYLPATILWSKDHRSPKRVWGYVLPFAYLGLQVLYLQDVGKLRGQVLRHDLEAGGPTVSAQRCGMLRSLGNLIPPTHGRSIGVGEARIISVGEELLHGFGVPFHEFVQRQLILLDQSIDLVYGRHLEITSTVGALSFPQGHPAIILRCSRECVEEINSTKFAVASYSSARLQPFDNRR